ncbi:MAG: outer membrane protein assembly factor BamB family protein, partial [Planctomycetota bacterium]
MRTLASALLLSCLIAQRATAAGTWPAHLYDNARTGSSPEHLQTPLELEWVHRSAHAPRHAWREPGWEVQRVDFDYVYHATVADDTVFFGSSADHKVYALDLSTGVRRWSVFTGGPVRFAPAVGPAAGPVGDRAGAERRLFVASDDGFLYCLAAATGAERWRRRGGPRDERMVGNEQIISRWPARSGALVEGDIVYFPARMCAQDAIY